MISPFMVSDGFVHYSKTGLFLWFFY